MSSTDPDGGVSDRSLRGRVANGLAATLLGLGTAAILAMLLVVTGNALSRQFLGRPIAGAFEIGRVLMPVVVFGGMAWTFGHVGHFRMDAVRSRLGPRAGRVSDAIQLLTALAVFGALTWLLSVDAVESLRLGEYLAGAVRIPVFPTRIAMALGALGTAIMVLHCLLGDGPPDAPETPDENIGDDGSGD